MRWSWKIGRLAGIGIYVHATFVLLLAYFAAQAYRVGGRAAAAASVIYLVALFAIVILHELGHALTARRFGIGTKDITLLPIGGVARLDRMPEEPRQELAIAIAGPAVNVVLALLFMVIAQFTGGSSGWSVGLFPGAGLAEELVRINVVLVLFNMIPAFPMDGGRVLRSLLAMKLGYNRATAIAARLGQAFAVLFGLYGMFRLEQPLLAVIAIFIWIVASAEGGSVQMRSALGDTLVEQVMIRQLYVLSPGDSLRRAVDYVLAGFQQDFPVVTGGQLAGLLTRTDLLKALAERGQDSLIGDTMRTRVPTIAPTERVDRALGLLQQAGLQTLPVVRDGMLVGVITTDNISEYLMVRAAQREAVG